MKKVLLGAFALVLMGAGCSFGGDDYSFDDFDYDYDDYEYGDYTIPEGWDSAVAYPLEALEGDEITIVATVTNDTGEDQVLHSIDIGESYLDGIAITSTDPEFTDSFLLDDGTYTHFFVIDVPAGESTEVTFTGRALTAGDYQGAFDICIDDGLTCNFLQVRTLVE
ncbi:hypothetical protein HON52_03780 [Candidatus Uhrbacteria bacterium]|jgi:hypothetical protein|nr:hypothetical protein [Candidatus Uhrbacteria bacterium]